MSTTPTSFPDVLLLGTIGDPDGTRTVISIVALLVAIGVALLLLAVWVHRTTRPDPELLAPLEAMGERSWRRGDPVWQRRRLDELRPDGAKPLAPSVAPPELDVSFDAGPTASGFDDLRGDPFSGPLPARRAAEPDAEDESVETDERTEQDGESQEDGDSQHDGEREDEMTGEDEASDGSPDSTPPGVDAPIVLDFPDGEFDEEALAAARAELERELAESGSSERPVRQLDLFGRGDADT